MNAKRGNSFCVTENAQMPNQAIIYKPLDSNELYRSLVILGVRNAGASSLDVA